MKALLVTSRVTFVPRNYDDLVVPLATCPHIGGLLVLDNASLSLAARAAGLLLSGAPRLGRTLLRNLLGPSARRRARAWTRAGKPVFRARSINSPEVAALVRDHGFDLVINARTRQIYRERILRTPRLGCINVHHGLLPDQRGTLCDLWSLAERRAAGFSIHVMAPAIDAGPILARVRLPDDRDYVSYLKRSTRVEADTLRAVLARIEARGAVEGAPNVASAELVVRRDPDRHRIRALRKEGVRL
jgi:methionyl-tRNA formyltransferase